MTKTTKPSDGRGILLTGGMLLQSGRTEPALGVPCPAFTRPLGVVPSGKTDDWGRTGICVPDTLTLQSGRQNGRDNMTYSYCYARGHDWHDGTTTDLLSLWLIGLMCATGAGALLVFPMLSPTNQTCTLCRLPGEHASALGCVEALHAALADARRDADEQRAIGYGEGATAARQDIAESDLPRKG